MMWGAASQSMLSPLLAAVLVAQSDAGRLVVGSQGALFSEGILTWDDVLGLDSSATLYVSGKLGTSCGPSVEAQARCALESVASTFSLGFGIPIEDHPMRWATECKVYLVDMGDYDALNTVYAEFFDVPDTAPPARLCLAVDELPINGLVEVQCTGHCDNCPWAVANGLREADSNYSNLSRPTLEMPTGYTATAVTAWLQGIGLGQYSRGFLDSGYDDMDVLKAGLSDQELRDDIGVTKPGHVKKLQMHLAGLRSA